MDASVQTVDGHTELSACPALPSITSDLTIGAENHLKAFNAESPAQGYLENLVRRQIARHAAALDLAHEVEGAVIGGAKRNGPLDVAAALRMPAVVDTLRYQAVHERGLDAAIQRLQRLQPPASIAPVPQLLAAESECLQYLADWQRRRDWQCPACAGQKRFWLLARRRFECACGRQYPLTLGTIFLGTHVPLPVWFTTVFLAVIHPDATVAEIAHQTGARRRQTIAAIMKRVLTALASTQADVLLAGVNGLAADYLLQVHLNRTVNKSGEPPS